MDATTIGIACNDILTACTDAFAQDGANTAPARMFITHGQPVAAADELVVWSPGIRSTKPFPLTRLSAVRGTVVPALDITIELWRSCWPAAQMSSASKALPDPSNLTAAALSLDTDAGTLFGYITGLVTAGRLFPSLPTIGRADDVALSPLVPLPPQGQLAGWRWPIAVKLAIP